MEPVNPLVEGFVGALIPVLGSIAGFFKYMRTRNRVRDDERAEMIHLLMGLAQNRIVFQGMTYIERGWVTNDEYEDLHRYLYDPYHRLGGNGTAERIMHAVERLPLRPTEPIAEKAFQIPIRESDPTGVPLERPTIGEPEDDRRNPDH